MNLNKMYKSFLASLQGIPRKKNPFIRNGQIFFSLYIFSREGICKWSDSNPIFFISHKPTNIFFFLCSKFNFDNTQAHFFP